MRGLGVRFPLLALTRGAITDEAEAVGAELGVGLEEAACPLLLGAVLARVWKLAISITAVSEQDALPGEWQFEVAPLTSESARLPERPVQITSSSSSPRVSGVMFGAASLVWGLSTSMVSSPSSVSSHSSAAAGSAFALRFPVALSLSLLICTSGLVIKLPARQPAKKSAVARVQCEFSQVQGVNIW